MVRLKRPAVAAWLVFLGGTVLLSRAAFAQSPTAPILAGAYYFDGWSGQTYHITERLQSEFTDREPVWGWRDDTVAIMEQQIDLAADHGLHFWAFDWYWPEGVEKQTPLNQALALYRQAQNRDRLRSALLVANHQGFRIGPDDWDQVCALWLEQFKQPTQLLVDGKPLILFFSPRELLKSFGGPAEVKAALDRLRDLARAEGLAGVCVGACATPGPEHGWNDLDELNAASFDLLTGYNYSGVGGGKRGEGTPYSTLVEGSQNIWDLFAVKSALPYVPVVTVGFDKRPWEDPSDPSARSIFYVDRSPEALEAFARSAAQWVREHPDHTTRERLIMLYAWNENGEGGYLTPTKSDGAKLLEAVERGIRPPAE